ncbi:hypothetical protein [Salinarimonas ramus]|uniref:Oxidoreductase molybdopterin-binding domain-containing protein n=1 Tax=Salinarimonas ramus TaxID=690164 RepID=A0A917QBV2_9HYPH|nr:hypothetical protein [Salinarimonas ramus]GGK41833.1 hypothetical protein GCM10011322_31230 [Salinarimonas ramus]
MSLRAMLAALAFFAALVAVGSPAAMAEGGTGGAIRLGEKGARGSLAVARIDALPQHEMPSGMSLDPAGLTFSGALLSDVLVLIGAADAPSVTLRAVDGYAAVVPREDWERWPLVLATRVDGRPMTLRDRGPARLLYPVNAHPELDERTYIDRSVWMIDEIAW